MHCGALGRYKLLCSTRTKSYFLTRATVCLSKSEEVILELESFEVRFLGARNLGLYRLLECFQDSLVLGMYLTYIHG